MDTLSKDSRQLCSVDLGAECRRRAFATRARTRGKHVVAQQHHQPRDLAVEPSPKGPVVLWEQSLVLRADVVYVRPQQVSCIPQRRPHTATAVAKKFNLLLVGIQELAAMLNEEFTKFFLGVALHAPQEADNAHAGWKMDVRFELRRQGIAEVSPLHSHLILDVRQNMDVFPASFMCLQQALAESKKLQGLFVHLIPDTGI
mmetsp:Transcript_25025/g.58728  ORF Transcript_25025/g.58728 Transcript_25025/m.58728 type:complete len:201 (-) Transcript_25025:139-741(-)